MKKLRKEVEIHPIEEADIKDCLSLVVNELRWAMKNHERFNSPHEAFAIMKEECDELWEQVRRDDLKHAKRECIQTCAMAMRFLIDSKEWTKNGKKS